MRRATSLAGRIANVIGAVVSVFVVVVGTLGIAISIATHFAPEGEYTVFGHPALIVVSGSMAPAINTGDLLIDDPINGASAEKLHAGQIISFRSHPASVTLITHRIVDVRSVAGQVEYITKGDVNNAPDATPVAASQIVGVFNRTIPYGGYVLHALHQPLVLGLLLASPVLWLLSGQLFEWARETDTGRSQQRSRRDARDGDGSP